MCSCKKNNLRILPEVTSLVTDFDGNVLENVHVWLKSNPSMATTTNANGYFTLPYIDPNDTVVFSYMTEVTEVAIKGMTKQTVLNIVSSLDEVIISSPKDDSKNNKGLKLLLGGLAAGIFLKWLLSEDKKTVKAKL